MKMNRIARNYNANPLRASDLIYIRSLTSRQQRIVKLIEQVALYGDTSYSVECELRSEVKDETDIRWISDVEAFIEDKLSVDVPYWVRRWAMDVRNEPRYEEPRYSYQAERDIDSARVRLAAEVTARETIAIAQAIANLMNAGR